VILAFVMVLTGMLIWIDVSRDVTSLDEITEVPLMAAMFVAMVWHARRRLTAMEETERVSQANLRLLERERRFVQDASHELRTPITVALGHAELIQRSAKDPILAEDAAVIAEELMRLRHLANRLLLLAGAEDPEFLRLEPVDVEPIVVDAVRRWTATPRRWLLGNTEEATVMADGDRLEVALDALIENAVNHTRDSDTIEVAIRRRDTRAVISVRDTGAGIRAPDVDHIFDRFARADPGRSRHTGGFGLGLSIVKAIVDAHGGEVHVASAIGVGTTFEILLPLSPVIADRPERTSMQGTGRLAPASTPAVRALDAYAREHDV
jgi:signal transduction histidine kinase